MKPANNYLFNFSASYLGGGFKRLYEYAKWFNNNGGAWFIVHPQCSLLADEFSINRYFIVTQSRAQRILKDCHYLNAIIKESGCPDLYYSYGIPVYLPVGRVNWFHLSNVLPLDSRGISLSLLDRVKFAGLGWRVKRQLQHADVISAESNYSLHLIDSRQGRKLFLSVNGSNDELRSLSTGVIRAMDNIAVVIGTYRYKAVEESYRVFKMLNDAEKRLKLMIIGDPKSIPRQLAHSGDVIMRGFLSRLDVIDCLRRARYYISTTQIENSYNAAAEGVYLAEESYISDIPPHRELLMNVPFDEISISGVNTPLLRVMRKDLSGENLKTWEEVVSEMIERYRAERPAY